MNGCSNNKENTPTRGHLPGDVQGISDNSYSKVSGIASREEANPDSISTK